MLPDPLHPALVHFPIVLMSLLPLVALGALWALRRGVAPMRAWMVPVALAGALSLSAWTAVETGEDQGDKAEKVVGEAPVETHEEAGERFLLFSGIVFVLSAAGLVRGTAGRGARIVATAATFGLFVAGVQVGHSGGTLVYGNGASSGVSQLAPGSGAPGGAATAEQGKGDDDD